MIDRFYVLRAQAGDHTAYTALAEIGAPESVPIFLSVAADGRE